MLICNSGIYKQNRNGLYNKRNCLFRVSMMSNALTHKYKTYKITLLTIPFPFDIINRKKPASRQSKRMDKNDTF